MQAPTIDAELDAIEADFALFADWEERYAHVIDLGRALAPLPDAAKTEANRVRGCASQVWLQTRHVDGRMRFVGDSDAHIVRGLVALVLRLFSDRTPEEILRFDPQAALARLGLDGALSPQRSNGLRAMIERIRREAAARAPA